MAKRWQVNTASGPRVIDGKLLGPGEGTWVDDGPLAPNSWPVFTSPEFAALAAAGGLVPGQFYNVAGALYQAINGTQSVLLSSGGGGGGGGGIPKSVASQAEMVALAAAVGDECVRTDLATGGLRYELTALPASSAGNWQALQGFIDDNTVRTLAIVAGKLPRQLLVWVAAATEVTVSDGTTSYVLYPSAYAHVIPVFEKTGVADPTAITVQRTAGSANSGVYQLEGV